MPCALVIYGGDISRLVGDLHCVYSGPEHLGTSGSTGQPSYCTLPMFHPAKNLNDPVNGLGYTSNDGHLFECNNPVVMQQAFHV
jgi:hypothetical protein